VPGHDAVGFRATQFRHGGRPGSGVKRAKDDSMKIHFPAAFAGLAAVAGVAAALATVALMTSARAQNAPQPGLWKMTVTTQSAGRPAVKAAQNTCITPEHVKKQQEGSESGAAAQRNCQRVKFERSATGMTMRYKCSGELAMEMTTTYAYDGPQHYTVAMKATGARAGKAIASTTTIDARRIGECPPK
jgi:hypothetical protein